jgi:hypothetical protein
VPEDIQSEDALKVTNNLRGALNEFLP